MGIENSTGLGQIFACLCEIGESGNLAIFDRAIGSLQWNGH